MTTLIIRRGLSTTCQAFIRIFGDCRGLEVMTDRRIGNDRRRQHKNTSAVRRMGERRRPPPRTWKVADFVAVDFHEDGPCPDTARPENLA